LPFLLLFALVASKKQYRKVLGETIRVRRKGLDMSQERLAEKSDLHHNFIGEIERGEKAATVDTIVKIAKGLGIHPSELLARF
jgi:transcriptional regulator with XRE-family HTH domain